VDTGAAEGEAEISVMLNEPPAELELRDVSRVDDCEGKESGPLNWPGLLEVGEAVKE